MKNRLPVLVLVVVIAFVACKPELIPAPAVTIVPTVAAPAQKMGILKGKVTVGPLTPVERPPQPGVTATPIPPEVYTSRSINIYQADGKTLVTNVPFVGDGTYQVALPAGTYVIALPEGMKFGMSKDLPKTVEIRAGETVTLDINIDTGIR